MTGRSVRRLQCATFPVTNGDRGDKVQMSGTIHYPVSSQRKCCQLLVQNSDAQGLLVGGRAPCRMVSLLPT